MADVGATEISTPEKSNTPFIKKESEIKDKSAEKKQEEERFNARKSEALERIKNGEDTEGNKLYKTYQKSLKDKSVSDTSALFVRASESVGRINDPGEANKAVISMDLLYKKLGFEGYKIDSKDITTEDRKTALRSKIAEDFNGLSERLADKFIDGYVRCLVELQDAKEDLKKLTEKEESSRSEIRVASYRVEDKKAKLIHAAEKGSADIDRKDFGKQLGEEITKKEEATKDADKKKFDDLEQDQKSKLINDSVSKYKESLDEENKSRVDRMSEDRKNEAFEPIARLDQEIANQRTELTNNLNADPWDVCEIVSRIKELNLEKKLLIKDANISLAEQRIDEANEGLEVSRNNTLKNFIRGKDIRKSLGNLVSAGKEWASSRVSIIGEKLKNIATDHFDRISFAMEQGKDLAAEELRSIDEAFFLEARIQTSSVRERISDFVTGSIDKGRGIILEGKTGILNIEMKYYKEKYEVNESWQTAKANLVEGLLITSVKAAGKVAEATRQNMGEEIDKRIEEIRNSTPQKLKEKNDSIKERNDNLLFLRLEKDLERRILMMEEIKKAIASKEEIGEDIDENKKNEGEDVVLTSPGEKMEQSTKLNVLDENTKKGVQQEEGHGVKGNKEKGIKTRVEYEAEQIKRKNEMEKRCRDAHSQVDTLNGIFPALLKENKEANSKISDIFTNLDALLNGFDDEEDLDKRQNMLNMMEERTNDIQGIINNLN